MGAPAGHPFFGNQYTDGGYLPGSFTYAAGAEGIGESGGAAIVPGLPVKVPAPILCLVAVGALIVVARIAYHRFKPSGAPDPAVEDGTVASFGVCESCGEGLTSSGSAQLQQDEGGDFVICQSCSHPNRAKYGNEDEQNRPGSDL